MLKIFYGDTDLLFGLNYKPLIIILNKYFLENGSDDYEVGIFIFLFLFFYI